MSTDRLTEDEHDLLRAFIDKYRYALVFDNGQPHSFYTKWPDTRMVEWANMSVTYPLHIADIDMIPFDHLVAQVTR